MWVTSLRKFYFPFNSLGSTLGIEDDHSTLLVTFIALIVHKLFEAFALGASFVKVPKPRHEWSSFLLLTRKEGVAPSLMWKIFGVYSLTLPSGFIVGLIVGESLEGDNGKQLVQ